ncbi:MAG: hypothetical protein JXA33_13770 [Anaerolineae bacterium]|nr:hypothetical protein [Anaerolineae bacterium]
MTHNIKELQALVAQAETRLAMTEFDFQSSVPVFGPLISAVRHWWNNISTRWYVRHYVQQQAEFNRAVLVVLNALIARSMQSDLETRDILVEIDRLASISLQQALAMQNIYRHLNLEQESSSITKVVAHEQ